MQYDNFSDVYLPQGGAPAVCYRSGLTVYEEFLDGGADAGTAYEVKELGQCIRRFVRALPERDGNVMVRRYFFADSVADIAKRYGLTENNVMVILSRTRKKLKAYLLKEGYL